MIECRGFPRLPAGGDVCGCLSTDQVLILTFGVVDEGFATVVCLSADGVAGVEVRGVHDVGCVRFDAVDQEVASASVAVRAAARARS